MRYQISFAQKNKSDSQGRTHRYWHCHLRMSDRALGRFHRTLIKYHGLVTCSFVLSLNGTPGRTTVQYAIKLPATVHWDFVREAGVALEHPPRVQLGLRRPETPEAIAYKKAFERMREQNPLPGMKRSYNLCPGRERVWYLDTGTALEGAEAVWDLLDGKVDLQTVQQVSE